MRAMHAPRAAQAPGEAAPEAPVRRAPGARAPPAKRAEITWPPTAESRAAATPLYKRKV
jgi:hypothetical protein